MTALPQGRALTVEEYAALGEDEFQRSELHEGCLVMEPSPLPDHSNTMLELHMQIRPWLPEHLEALADVDVDLQLAPAGAPGFVRVDIDLASLR